MAADCQTFFQVFPECLSLPSVGSAPFWLTQAQGQLAIGRLGNSADLAVYLYMAHNMVLGAQDIDDGNLGALPGDTLGPIASKSAGGLSVSYDAGMVSIEGGGPYNATSYGQRLWKLIQSASRGGVYVSIPDRPTVYGPTGIFGWR